MSGDVAVSEPVGSRRAIDAPGGATGLSGVWLAAALAVLLTVVVVAAVVGPARLGVGSVLASMVDRLPFVLLDGGLTVRQEAILWQLRLPRVVLGLLVGATLSVAGAAYQGVFRNPLADPYLLGVAAGAGLGATVVIVAGHGGHPVALPLAAFTGAAVAVAATYWLGRTVGGSHRNAAIVLAGVAVAAFATAAQTFVQQRHAESLREVYAWILGRLVTAGWGQVVLVVPYVAVAIAVIVSHRRLLDVLAVGETEAASLGVRPARLRLLLVGAATLGTAAAVAVSGLIGFVGIVVPHTVRLLVGPSYRVIVPLAAIGGGAFLVAADVLARTVIAPAELPIGVVTAAVGAPFFTAVLRHRTAVL